MSIRTVDTALAEALANLAVSGIHDPSWMPFRNAWTDQPRRDLHASAISFFERCRSSATPQRWDMPFGIFEGQKLVGCCSVRGVDFVEHRTFQTGSWLGHAFQGQGIGKEARRACLHLGFAGLDATTAITDASIKNAASLRVTTSLGYEAYKEEEVIVRGVAETYIHYKMSVAYWRDNLSGMFTIENLDAFRRFLRLPERSPPAGRP